MSLNRASIINRLTASGGPFAGNKPALEAMNDAGLEAVDKAYPEGDKKDKVADAPAPPVNTPVTPPSTPAATGDAGTGGDAGTAGTVQTVSISRNEYAEILAASNAFKAQQEARKLAIVTSLSAAQTSFSTADLQAMDMPTLEKLSEAFKVNQPVISTSASYVGLPVSVNGNKPAMRDLPDPLGLKASGLRPDGKQIEN
jgi:hypothetical protein